MPGPHLSTSNSISRRREPPAALVLAPLVLALLVLTLLEHAACLPLDDLSSYSSAWERPSAIVVDQTALDASTSAVDADDAGATPSGADAPPDASSPPPSSPDASPGAPAPDASAPRSIDDGGVGLDAGAADAAP